MDQKLSKQDVEDVVRMYVSGMSSIEISKLYNVSGVTIRNYLKRNGVIMRKVARDDLDVDMMVAMYESGMSYNQISKAVGADHHVITSRIKSIVSERDRGFYGRQTAKMRTCVNCGKEFLLRDEKGNSIKRYKTCSDKCLHEYLSKCNSDERSSSWRGGRSQGYYQKQARKTKKMICEKCGETNVRLDVHHIDKNKSNNLPENIMILCVSCHAKLHYESGDSNLQGAP